MAFRAVIYDMDGVLIDSEPFWRSAELMVFPKYNIHITEDDCRSTAGLRIVEVVEHWKKFFSLPLLKSQVIADEVVNEVIRMVNAHGEALSGVYDSLSLLQSKGLPLAVATSSPKLLMDSVLERLEIQNHFSATISADGLQHAKPHPEIFLNTALALQVDPTDCLVIEDTVNGMVAAKAARMKVCVIPEHLAQNDTRFSLADWKLKSLDEISSLF